MHLKWKPIKTDGFDSLLTQLHCPPPHAISAIKVYMCVYIKFLIFPPVLFHKIPLEISSIHFNFSQNKYKITSPYNINF